MMFGRRPPGPQEPQPQQAQEYTPLDPVQLYHLRERSRRQQEEYRRRQAEQQKADLAKRAAEEARLAAMSPEERAAEQARQDEIERQQQAQRAAEREQHQAAEAKHQAEAQSKHQAQQQEQQAKLAEYQRQRQAQEEAERAAQAKQKAEADAAQLALDRDELARYERDHHQEISDAARKRLGASPSDAPRLAAADASAHERHAAELAELRAAQDANKKTGQQLRSNLRAAVAAALPRLEPLRAARQAGKLHEDASAPIARDIFAAVAEVVAASTPDRTLAYHLHSVCEAHAYTLEALEWELEALPARIERAFASVAADARAPLILTQPSPSTLAQRIEHASGETLHAHASAYAKNQAEAEAGAKLDDACTTLAPHLLKLLRARGVEHPEAWLTQARSRWFDERGVLKAEVLAGNDRARGALRVFIVAPRTPWHAHRNALIEGLSLLVEHDLTAYPQANAAPTAPKDAAPSSAEAGQLAASAQPQHGAAAPPQHRATTPAITTADDHTAKRAIDAAPAASASAGAWVHYLGDLHGFLYDQTGAEKEALQALRANREAHPVIGGVAETFAGIKAGFHSVKIPDAALWDQVLGHLDQARSRFAGDQPDLDGARREMATAVKLFHEAHHKTYEYRSRTEGGGEAAITALRGVEIGCDITLVLLSGGLGGGAANVMKLGARGLFKAVVTQAGKNLAKTAARAAVVGGADKLAQGAAEEETAHAMGLGEFDAAKIVREAGEAAAMNFLGVLVGGKLNQLFMKSLGGILKSRLAPEAAAALAERYGASAAALPLELFVSRGWRFLVGVAGDACTTTLITGLSVIVDELRTGSNHPTADQFVSLVVEQMIRNGLLQVVLTAVTHERAKTSAANSEQPAAPANDKSTSPSVEPKREAKTQPQPQKTEPTSNQAKAGGAKSDTAPQDQASAGAAVEGDGAKAQTLDAFKAMLESGEYKAKIAELSPLVEKLRSHPEWGPVLAKHSDLELMALIGYTGSDYRIINQALRGNSRELALRLKPYIDLATDALHKLPDYQGVLVRGVKHLTPEQLAPYEQGEEVTEYSFTSTSYELGAQFDGEVQFIIEGTRAKKIDFLSLYPEQKEALFVPGTKFRVLEHKTVGNVHFIKMREL